MSIDTKTILLDSAERVARARGFDGFSYADLAAEVEISKASIHNHFASKATLAVALMKASSSYRPFWQRKPGR
jgi:TetR/AcrR family transcriptional repressor of nem operon